MAIMAVIFLLNPESGRVSCFVSLQKDGSQNARVDLKSIILNFSAN